MRSLRWNHRIIPCEFPPFLPPITSTLTSIPCRKDRYSITGRFPGFSGRMARSMGDPTNKFPRKNGSKPTRLSNSGGNTTSGSSPPRLCPGVRPRGLGGNGRGASRQRTSPSGLPGPVADPATRSILQGRSSLHGKFDRICRRQLPAVRSPSSPRPSNGTKPQSLGNHDRIYQLHLHRLVRFMLRNPCRHPKPKGHSARSLLDNSGRSHGCLRQNTIP